jgi:hypothetical protein
MEKLLETNFIKKYLTFLFLQMATQQEPQFSAQLNNTDTFLSAKI